mmetsp:Transcript_20795/g.48234  ORF Transcript_20795/g.48234 Transcript_20795/m.48234 type:complete len:108 (-) Transcript_20795:158-481(-)
MAYRPGKGLCKDAVERLRARKEGRSIALPGEDTSEQANQILGNGVVKKTRCGTCTRPLLEEEIEKDSQVCFRCRADSGKKGPAADDDSEEEKQRARSRSRSQKRKRS